MKLGTVMMDMGGGKRVRAGTAKMVQKTSHGLIHVQYVDGVRGFDTIFIDDFVPIQNRPKRKRVWIDPIVRWNKECKPLTAR